MNKFMLKTLSAAALAGALSTAAVADEPQFGVGVGIAGQDSTVIKGSMTLNNNLRLEPFLGFTYYDGNNNFQVGTALELTKPISSKITGYYGGYVGLSSTDGYVPGYNNTTANTTVTNFNLGPVAGVEYAFDKQFTLGAEVRFDLGFGDVTTFGTNSSVLLRYYF